jgi:hypothetical protein
MYVRPDFKSKKDLKDAVKARALVTVYAPGLGTPVLNGKEYVCGPHSPRPHTWYATVLVLDGRVTKVIS